MSNSRLNTFLKYIFHVDVATRIIVLIIHAKPHLNIKKIITFNFTLMSA